MPVIMAVLIQFIHFDNHRAKVDSFVILDHTLVAPAVIKD